MKNLLLILFISLLTFGLSAQQPQNMHFGMNEIPEYIFRPDTGKVLLQMDYASPKIRNREAWQTRNNRRKIYQVDLIFTKYPYYKKDWITHYDSLLKDRVHALAQIAPEVLDGEVKWNLILQTNCRKEADAKKMFHGAVFWYRELPALKPISTVDTVKLARQLPKEELLDEMEYYSIEQLVSGRFPFSDSIVLKVFERNPEWDKMLVVADWTGSMYEYGAQALRWHKVNIDKKRVKRFVFFNDGDKKTHKKIGKTGGIYFAGADNILKVIEVMNKVMKNGDGGDIEENDLEAVIKGINKTRKFKDVILIADNKSHVRDMELLSNIKVPVKIILCGSYPGSYILNDYIEIARKTGGSVHTIQEDIDNIADIKEGDRIKILNEDYIMHKGKLEKAKKRNYMMSTPQTRRNSRL